MHHTCILNFLGISWAKASLVPRLSLSLSLLFSNFSTCAGEMYARYWNAKGSLTCVALLAVVNREYRYVVCQQMPLTIQWCQKCNYFLVSRKLWKWGTSDSVRWYKARKNKISSFSGFFRQNLMRAGGFLLFFGGVAGHTTPTCTHVSGSSAWSKINEVYDVGLVIRNISYSPVPGQDCSCCKLKHYPRGLFMMQLLLNSS